MTPSFTRIHMRQWAKMWRSTKNKIYIRRAEKLRDMDRMQKKMYPNTNEGKHQVINLG